MKLFLGVIVLCYATELARGVIFQYEKMHNYGLGRRVIPNYRRVNSNAYAYPNPLPTTSPPAIAHIRDPFPKLYQGARRRKLDLRVFTKSFNYPPSDVGQKILCESLVPCKITHVAIETEEAIPIILRGGVGYNHFTIIVRAKPGYSLRGNIRVFCNKLPEE